MHPEKDAQSKTVRLCNICRQAMQYIMQYIM